MKHFLSVLFISFLFNSLSFSQLQWSKYYPPLGGGALPIISDIEQTHDDFVFMIGSELFGDATVFKIHKFTGDTIWTKTDSSALKIMRIPNSDDYYIVRQGDVFISSENWLSRVDSTLNTVWKRDFELNSEVIQDFEVLSDGSAICFGTYSPGGPNAGLFLRRVDPNNSVIFIDTILAELPADDMTYNIEVLPSDKLIFSRLEDTVVTFYKYSPMGMFEDSANFVLPGIPMETEVGFATNPWDEAIAFMGSLEYDTTDIDTMDLAGYYYELDSGLNVTLSYEDTTRIFSGAPAFYTLGGTVRIFSDLSNPASPFNFGRFYGSTPYEVIPLGLSGGGFPNIPFLLEYIAPIQIIIGGSDFQQYWAASTTSVINDIDDLSRKYEDILVYPVPAGDMVNFKIEEAIGPDMHLIITDIQGRIVEDCELKSSLYTLNVSTYQNGLYFYRIESPGNSFNGKFQVLH